MRGDATRESVIFWQVSLSSNNVVGGTALRKAKISQNDAHAKCSTTAIKRSQILSMSSTCGNGRLAATYMSNASTGEKCAVTSGGSAVVEDSAVVRQKVAVDIPIAGLVGALENNTGIT